MKLAFACDVSPIQDSSQFFDLFTAARLQLLNKNVGDKQEERCFNL